MNTAFSDYKPVLRLPAFRRMWLAQLLALTAQNGIHFVQLVLIERLTGQSFQIGLMIAAFSLPPVLFSFFSGAMVDRFPKKWIIVFSNVLRALLAISYIFILRGLVHLPTTLLLTVYGITFLGAAVGSFYNPAVLAKLPLLVEDEVLVSANSLFNFTPALAQLLGLLILAPAAVKLFGLSGAFGLMGVFYLLAFFFVLKLPQDRGVALQKEERSMKYVVQELRAGWDFVIHNRPIALSIIQLTLVSALMLILAMIAPGYSARVLGLAPEDAVIVFAPAGVGMILAIFLIGRVERQCSTQWTQSVMLMLASLSFGLLSFISYDFMANNVPGAASGRSVVLSMLFMAMAIVPLGFGLYVIYTLAQTTLQRLTPEALRGRVFTVQFMLISLFGLAPLMITATLADIVGFTAMLSWLSAGCLLVGAISIYDAYHHRSFDL
jgi:MFS family permease